MVTALALVEFSQLYLLALALENEIQSQSTAACPPTNKQDISTPCRVNSRSLFSADVASAHSSAAAAAGTTAARSSQHAILTPRPLAGHVVVS